MIEKSNAIDDGKKVVLPKEFVYEVCSDGPIGIALALIEESEPHYHEKTTEWYLVSEGRATAYLDGKEIELRERDVLKIPPKTVHYVKMFWTPVEIWVISNPPWNEKDHYKV